MKRPLAGYLESERFKGKSCVYPQRRVMHSPAKDPWTQHDALLDLFAAIENLDRAATVLEIPRYVQLRGELVVAYMDLYGVLGRPFDQDAEPA